MDVPRSALWTFFMQIALLQIITGYEISVRVVDGDTVEHWTYTGQDTDATRQIRSVKEPPPTGPSSCVARETITPPSGQPHIARVVAVGSSTTLPCHVCGTSKEEQRKSKVWYKFHRMKNSETNTLLWQAQEVDLDMFDDVRLNRIYVTETHSLLIKDFQPNDVGTYFCEGYNPDTSSRMSGLAFSSPDIDGSSAVSLASIWHHMDQQQNIQVLFHLDVETSATKQQVTADGVGYPKPQGPHKDMEGNWIMYTHWSEWGECNVCGAAGERRRKGDCMIMILDSDRSAHPPYLDKTLRLYYQGAPCHSSLFMDHDIIVNRPQEVEMESCNMPCHHGESNGNFLPEAGLLDRIHMVTPKPIEHEVDEERVTRTKGESVRFPCNQQTPKDAVYWMNGTVLISGLQVLNKTRGRVEIDSSNSLRIHHTELWDSGRYACWVGELKTSTHILTVKLAEPEKDVWGNMKILFASFAVDFVLFLFGLCLQSFNRTVQIRRSR